MAWKSILVNALITVVVIFAGIKIFVPSTPPVDVDKIQKILTIQIKGVQARLGAIEDALSQQEGAVRPLSGQPTVTAETLQKMDRKLDVIVGKLSLMEQRIDNARAPSDSQPDFPAGVKAQGRMPARSGAGNPAAWLDNLSEEKRSEVEAIFKENARHIREKLPAKPDGRPPDRETMRKMVEESQQELKEELKEVLSEEEYQSFLDSFPKRPQTRTPAFPEGGRR